MNYLKIKSWDKFQQCDRNAPWIKLYTSLLQNYEFLNQSDNGKAAFCCLMLYCGQAGNKIPHDGKFLASIFCLDNDINLQALIDCGFLAEWSEEEYLNEQLSLSEKIEKRKNKDRERYHKKARKSVAQPFSESEKVISESEKRDFATPETETETETENNIREEKKEIIKKVLPLPDWLPLQDWEDYLEMRKRKGRNATNRAKQLVIIKLDELRKTGHDPGAVLRESIINGWTGVFALKGDRIYGNTNTKPNVHADFTAGIALALDELNRR